MFQSICFMPGGGSPGTAVSVDVGFLAEAMLFYERVRIVTGYGGLHELITRVGPELTLELLADGLLEVTYTPDALGIMTERTGTPEAIHKPTTFTIARFAPDEAARRIFTETTGRSGRGRRLANRFMYLLRDTVSMSEPSAQANEDFADERYLHEATVTYLRRVAPGSIGDPSSVVFSLEEAGDGFWQVESNVDWAKASRLLLGAPRDVVLTPAQVLAEVLETRGSLFLGALYSSELAVGDVRSQLIAAKCRDLITARAYSAKQISGFEEMVFHNGFALREAVNSGARSMEDVVQLVRDARRFKGWLSRQEPSRSLVEQYLEAVNRGTWASRLPARLVRWSLALVIGVMDPPTGIAVTTADTFLTERVARGWRPDQFVKSRLEPFAE